MCFGSVLRRTKGWPYKERTIGIPSLQNQTKRCFWRGFLSSYVSKDFYFPSLLSLCSTCLFQDTVCSLAWVKQALDMSHEADISEQKQPSDLSNGGGTCVSCEDTHAHRHIVCEVLAHCCCLPCGEWLIVQLLIASLTVEHDWTGSEMREPRCRP